MLTNSEIKLLLQIYKNNGGITAKEQTIFIVNSHFYNVISKLKNMNLLCPITIQNDLSDNRINLYELTLRGKLLVKILLGKDDLNEI